MKKLVVIALVFVLTAAIWPGNASAANSLKTGTIGVNVDVNNNTFGFGGTDNNNFMITGRYFFTPDFAVLAGVGMGIKGADAKGVDLGITGGARYYLKTDDFAPFLGATLFYSDTQDGDVKDFALMAEAGAEYFFHKQFSIEGKIGIGFTSQETTTTTTTASGGFLVKTSTTERANNFGTERLGISFNFYF
jgi:hypothetical protein